jgi:hypothetical protein
LCSGSGDGCAQEGGDMCAQIVGDGCAQGCSDMCAQIVGDGCAQGVVMVVLSKVSHR